MQKRGKIRELKGITLQYPSSSRVFYCKEWGQIGWQQFGRNSQQWPKMGWIQRHALKDGDTLIICTERGCRVQVCGDHYQAHIQEHTLRKLEGQEQ